MQKQKEVVLEPSTNTHTLKGEINEVKAFDKGLAINLAGEGMVVHGEHGTIKTEAPQVVKMNQQEYNPLTRKIHDARD